MGGIWIWCINKIQRKSSRLLFRGCVYRSFIVLFPRHALFRASLPRQLNPRDHTLSYCLPPGKVAWRCVEVDSHRVGSFLSPRPQIPWKVAGTTLVCSKVLFCIFPLPIRLWFNMAISSRWYTSSFLYNENKILYAEDPLKQFCVHRMMI